jgi:hypothetical protein
MDKPTRNLIQKATQDARRLLEVEYREQLEGTFDIHLNGTIAPKPGSHLNSSIRGHEQLFHLSCAVGVRLHGPLGPVALQQHRNVMSCPRS